MRRVASEVAEREWQRDQSSRTLGLSRANETSLFALLATRTSFAMITFRRDTKRRGIDL